MLGLDHAQRRADLFDLESQYRARISHRDVCASYAVQRVDDVLVHHHAWQAHRRDLASIAALKSANGTSSVAGVDDDDHREVVADERLRDVEDVAAELGDARR